VDKKRKYAKGYIALFHGSVRGLIAVLREGGYELYSTKKVKGLITYHHI